MHKKLFLLLFILFFCFIDVFAEGEATLKNIKVNGLACECNDYVCSIEVNSSQATITYELVDSNAKLDKLSGFKQDLVSQTTSIKVNVTNGDNKNEYEIIINKHVLSKDYTLKFLKINDKEIELKEDIYVYSYSAKYDEEKLVVEAKTNDSNAKIKSKLEYSFDLDESSKAIDIKVNAENGDEKDYRIVVQREQKPDTTLKSLKLDKVDLPFDKSVMEYDLTVEYAINSLIVEAIPNSEDATVKIKKDDSLVVGSNLIEVEVTNSDVTDVYKIVVTRGPNLDKSLANLKYLKVEEYSKLDFDPNILEYILKFKEIPNMLNIDAVSDSSDGVIEILNNENLIDGSIVVIKNKLNETGVFREYYLTIELIKNISENKTAIVITLIILVIVIIVLFVMEILSKKRKKIVRKKSKKIEKDDIEII